MSVIIIYLARDKLTILTCWGLNRFNNGNRTVKKVKCLKLYLTTAYSYNSDLLSLLSFTTKG